MSADNSLSRSPSRSRKELPPRPDAGAAPAEGVDRGGPGQNLGPHEQQHESGQPLRQSVLAGRGQQLWGCVSRAAESLPAQLERLRHPEDRARLGEGDGSVELWKVVLLLCAPLMLLSLTEHLAEGWLIPHNCWPARLLASLLSCAWLGLFALAQQQGWLGRCWPQASMARAGWSPALRPHSLQDLQA